MAIASHFSNRVRNNTAKPFILFAMPDKETQNDVDFQQATTDIDTLEYLVDMVNMALTTLVS